MTERPLLSSGALLYRIEGIDFSIFGYLPVLDVINQHVKTPHFIARFGLGPSASACYWSSSRKAHGR